MTAYRPIWIKSGRLKDNIAFNPVGLWTTYDKSLAASRFGGLALHFSRCLKVTHFKFQINIVDIRYEFSYNHFPKKPPQFWEEIMETHEIWFVKFRNELYDSPDKRADAAMDLTDALSGNQSAASPVQLSLSTLFRRQYASLHDAVDNF